MCRYALFGERIVVAAVKVSVAGFGVSVDFDARALTGADQEVGDIGIGEAGDTGVVQLRTFCGIRSAHLFQVQIGDGLRDREDGMFAVELRTEFAALFAKEGHEDDGPFGTGLKLGKSASDFDDGNCAAAIVVGAIVNAVGGLDVRLHCHAGGGVERADVVVVSGEKDGGFGKHWIGSAQDADDVLDQDFGVLRGGNVNGQKDRQVFVFVDKVCELFADD